LKDKVVKHRKIVVTLCEFGHTSEQRGSGSQKKDTDRLILGSWSLNAK
jgi:hypothetical protein